MTNNDPGPSLMDTDASAAGAGAQNSHWSSEAMETFDKYKEYHWKMHEYFDHLQNCGNNVKPPEKPKCDYRQYFREGENSPKEKLTGSDLQLYLEKNCKLDKVAKFQKVSEVTAIKTLNGMIPHLKRGYEEWKRAHASALSVSIDFGDWLNQAFQMH